MRIAVYTFRDAENNEFGSYQTQDYKKAEAYACQNKLKIVENIFVFDEANVVDDFSKADEDEDIEEDEDEDEDVTDDDQPGYEDGCDDSYEDE